MMPNATGSKVGATKPPRVEGSARASSGSSRDGGASAIASTPPTMFAQNVARSGAPGNTAAMPTIATSSIGVERAARAVRALRSHERAWIRCAQDDLRDLRVSTCAELGEQRLDAAIGVDQRQPAARVLALELGR